MGRAPSLAPRVGGAPALLSRGGGHGGIAVALWSMIGMTTRYSSGGSVLGDRRLRLPLRVAPVAGWGELRVAAFCLVSCT